MKRGKSQYSVEFLMTYGWALLILAIVIGVVYTFGWIEPSNFMPQKCSFYGQVGCRDFYLAENSFNLSLVNNFGVRLVVHGLEIVQGGVSVCNQTDFKEVWPRSGIVQVGLDLDDNDCNPDFLPGRRENFVTKVFFYSNQTCSECWDSNPDCNECLHVATGNVIGRVSR